jgi:cobalt ECF transporter T component CbiQ
VKERARRRKRGFIERSIESLQGALEHAEHCAESAEGAGFLQRLDPRVKLCGLLPLIVAAVSARRLEVTLLLWLGATLLGAASGITPRALATRTWLGVLIFTGAIALPAVFLTPGRTVWTLPLAGWPVTAQGCMAAARLVARAETAATLAVLLVFTTPWPHVLKALRTLRTPAILVVILGMTYRYIFVLLRMADDFFEARRSRVIRPMGPAAQRRMAAATAGVLLQKSLLYSEEVYLAMQSRGFRGEAYTLHDFRMKRRDWLAGAAFAVASGLAFWEGGR